MIVAVCRSRCCFHGLVAHRRRQMRSSAKETEKDRKCHLHNRTGLGFSAERSQSGARSEGRVDPQFINKLKASIDALR